VPCITQNPIVCFSGETFFHGSNAVVKGPPWIPSRDGFDPLTSLTAKERVAWNGKPWIAPWIAMVINSQYEWLLVWNGQPFLADMIFVARVSSNLLSFRRNHSNQDPIRKNLR
jgi:hypothetical protein